MKGLFVNKYPKKYYKKNIITKYRNTDLSKKVQKWIKVLPSYLILISWSLFTFFAITWVTMTSFKTNRELYNNVWAFPAEPQWGNYIKAWTTVKMGDFFINSLIVVTISVFVLVMISAPAAYILSRWKFKGSNFLTNLFIAGIGVPVPLLFIPLFFITTKLKIINSLPGLILIYIAVSIPFTVFLLTGFFGSLPKELEESAIIDGANDFQVYWKIMFPLATPGIITAAIFNFITLWNEYQIALVFISEPTNRTLSLGLYALQNAMQFTSDWVGLMAGVVIVMIPTLFLYTILSEKLISGITMGAIK